MSDFIVSQQPSGFASDPQPVLAVVVADAVDAASAAQRAVSANVFAAGALHVTDLAATVGFDVAIETTIVGLPVGEPPVAEFTVAPPKPTRGTRVSFDGTSSAGEIASWDWTFGDGNADSGAQVEHQYSAKGDYTVTLLVRGVDGQTDQQDQTVTVS